MSAGENRTATNQQDTTTAATASNRYMLVSDASGGALSYMHFTGLEAALRQAEVIVNDRVTADVKLFRLTEVSVSLVR